MILRRVGRSHRNSLKSGRKAARLSYFARGSLDWLSADDIPVCLVTSNGYAAELQIVVQVVVGDRAHDRVQIVEGPFWWSRRPGMVNDWVCE